MKKNKAIFTSILPNYLPKAFLLGESIGINGNIDVDFYIVIPQKSQKRECLVGWNVLYLEDLINEELIPWAYMHDVVELCTAIKPFAMEKLLGKYEQVIYIDPDAFVYNNLTPCFESLNESPGAIVPHFINFSNNFHDIKNNELSILKHGIFNLGYLALSNTEIGKKINHFWKTRCYYYCERNSENGVFTDQKFFDVAPLIFPSLKIDLNYGIDVASWNLFERKLSFESNGQIMVNKKWPLIFYHFSSFDNGVGLTMSTIGGKESPIIMELWYDYINKHNKVLKLLNKEELVNDGSFSIEGKLITPEHRKLFRNYFLSNGEINFVAEKKLMSI